ncbi:transcriptional regulator with XRE-family HTH domain [Alicyclobacillus sacchari]|uniref:Transcriptional regulator with XRE-family HTH domain n=1 Tax=Alicyclobacillus sacchari TaxID=392010 RepID=A0A4R8LJ78_9BACL|nr:helix-turn-helix domain-containing protein [Alicyclobacillus sacchari]TDY43438.1 transcriptional regulator with XRE-family HTH domain [Alicyclobacillus sacchari]GMA55807.1 hypothetical protein GCM10025858_03100 [Alicyclobacillus sacchari]
METLGRKLRALRKQRGLTQLQLASGVSTPSMISQIETDRSTPSQQLLAQLAHRLGVELSYFETEFIEKSDELQCYRSAKEHMEAGKYREAIDLFQSLSWPLAPQFRPDALYMELATCYFQLQDYERAANMYESLIELGCNRSDISIVVRGYYHGALARRKLGQDDVATTYLERAREIIRTHVEFYMPISMKIGLSLARLHLQSSRFAKAKEIYLELLELTHKHSNRVDFATIYHGLACASTYLGEFEDALVYCDRAVDEHENSRNFGNAMRCRINHGLILRLANRYDEAYEYLQELRSQMNPHDDLLRTALHHELAQLCLSLERFDEGIDHTETALASKRLDIRAEIGLRTLRIQLFSRLQDFVNAHAELDRLEGCCKDDPTRLPRGYASMKCDILHQIGAADELIEFCQMQAGQALTTGEQYGREMAPLSFWIFPRQ